jgi:hypothetical protein
LLSDGNQISFAGQKQTEGHLIVSPLQRQEMVDYHLYFSKQRSEGNDTIFPKENV